MFENILGQSVTAQLSRDLASVSLAPSMLFSGPPASGKGAAALELARILSCENPKDHAPWNCSCTSCSRHRLLIHPDLLILGPRPFSPEIAAAAAAFLREPESTPTVLLFLRSVRKLLARFSPVLWEDDPKLAKLSPLITGLDESLDELDKAEENSSAMQKTVDEILKNAFKLEAEGIANAIPISQIRRAAYWSRLAPAGKRKLLLIEHADCMLDAARNSLLKILEEPPDTVSIVLTSARPEALLPTITSRLRPYRFAKRDKESEAAVLRRVFRAASPGDVSITAYLESFLPVTGDALAGLAAFFAASLAAAAVVARRKKGISTIPPELIQLGKYTAPLAEAAGFEKQTKISEIISIVIKGADGFSIRSLFTQFLRRVLSLVSESLRSAESPLSVSPVYNDLWRRETEEAQKAVETFNQNPATALERMAIEMCRGFSEAAA
ncbi:hypothetical protein FACS1894147_04470 [Spirochaetia bacterium]|nr:hypothetical protein FACS1894147_04470 [Spirochaetia bacterium]